MDEQILKVVKTIGEWTGIVIHEYHYPMIEYELARLTDGGDLRRGAELVLRGDPEARRRLIGVISNSETYLFRHWGHFETLRDLAGNRFAAGRPFHVLSAGCSSGEECWSAAAIVAGVYLASGCDLFSVSGWDIDPERLRRARTAIYGRWATRKGLHGYESFFEKTDDRWRVADRLRRFVDFAAVNLIEGEWPSSRRYDAILFRNVSIYWTQQTADTVRDRLTGLLADDGILLAGPSDPVQLDPRRWSVETGSGAPVFRRNPGAPDRNGQTSRVRTKRRFKLRNVCKRQKTTGITKPRPVTKSCPDPAGPVAQPQLSEIEDLANRGQYETALEKLPGAGSNPAPSWKLWEGILLLNLDRVEDAIRVFRHCVFLEPEDPSYRRWLAAAMDSAGHKAEAAREYRNARNIEVKL